MAFYVTKKLLTTNAGLAAQWDFITGERKYDLINEQDLVDKRRRAGLQINDARSHSNMWLDFDTTAKRLMLGDEGFVVLDDLMPLARNVSVGKMVTEYRKYSPDLLEARSSLDGNHAKPTNRTDFEFDGAVIPIHSSQVGRQWREVIGMRDEGYDALRDDQEAAVKAVRFKMLEQVMGDGTDLRFQGYRNYGIKNSPGTIAVNLGAGGLNVNFVTATYAQARAGVIALLQAIQGPGNNARGDVTLYVSDDIWFNFLNIANEEVSTTETIYTALLRTPGLAAIKRTEGLTGNEVIGIILRSEYIRPVVGMPVTTTPIPRVTPMDQHNLLVWSAMGLQILTDAGGRSGVLYAAAV